MTLDSATRAKRIKKHNCCNLVFCKRDKVYGRVLESEPYISEFFFSSYMAHNGGGKSRKFNSKDKLILGRSQSEYE